MLMNTDIEAYFVDGCGRCSLGGTPECKVHRWTEELKLMRTLVNECGLTEEVKWGMPCYTFQTKNILNIVAFKEYCSIAFFKGALLKDELKVLQSPGENSHHTRQFRFTNTQQIIQQYDLIKAYIFEAIEVEKSGKKITSPKASIEDFPEELIKKFTELPVFEVAFKALTPGRQRGYLLHFSQAKQSQTRITRIEKCIPKILEGKGFNDR